MLHQTLGSSTFPFSANELERCAALKGLGILDTDPDQNFDAAVELACSLFEVPIALIALIDEQREWFKASRGLGIKEAPRQWAFCNYTIQQDDLFVVEDAELDPRFSSNPLVTGEPGIRFYAGVPVGLNDDQHLGTLCIIGKKPRTLSDKEADYLRTLGRVVSNLLRQFHQTQTEQKLQDELGLERAAVVFRENQLRGKQSLLEYASELAAIGSWEYSPSTGQILWGAETRQILGITSDDDVTPDVVRSFFVEEYDQPWRQEISKFAASTTSLVFEGKIRTPGGREKWVRVLGKTENNEGAISKFGLLQDITQEHIYQKQIKDMAERDSLTGLANRFSLFERLRSLMRDDAPFSFALLDVDGFKGINDTFGHAAGDKCLKRIARKLRALEQSGAIVARIAGDEFAIILPGAFERRQLDRRLARIVSTLTFPMGFHEQTANVSVSIGVATRQVHAECDAEALMAEADLALYEAKAAGRSRHVFFRKEMKAKARRKSEIIGNIREALRKCELELFYQAKRDLRDGNNAGFEALLRWRRADGSVVTPEMFRPALEDPVLSGDITAFVVVSALDQARLWIDGGNPKVSISINVGPHQFRDSTFPAFLLAEMKKRSLPASAIEIEVTENVLVERDTDQVLMACRAFTDHGLRISFDDFGTGFASLTHLLDFPVRAIKIDRSFVARLMTDHRAVAFLKAVCDLAHSLSLEVVAEGIETYQQCELITSVGCDYGQGYYLHRPSPAGEVAFGSQ